MRISCTLIAEQLLASQKNVFRTFRQLRGDVHGERAQASEKTTVQNCWSRQVAQVAPARDVSRKAAVCIYTAYTRALTSLMLERCEALTLIFI